MSLIKKEVSQDSTTKLHFDKGHHAVLIPQKNKKTTLCISSQVGCPIACTFCLTGKQGFKQNLTEKDILEQFEKALEEVQNKEADRTKQAQTYLTALVFMGMGEPLLNKEQVEKAIEHIHKTYSYPYKKITLSTIAPMPQFKQFIEQKPKVKLALSLHSAIQRKRDTLIQSQKNTKIEELIELCNTYNKDRKEKIMIEYIMIEDFNDTEEDLKELLALNLSPMTNINLIPLNGELKLNNKTYKASNQERCEYFKEKLRKAGYKCFIRQNRGTDIKAACGMLD